MFKKLTSLFFEVEEVEEEYEEEEVIESLPLPPIKSKQVAETVKIQPVVESVPSKLRSITIDELVEEAPLHKEKTTINHNEFIERPLDMKSKIKIEPIEKEYEFAPVISPIFGVKQDETYAKKKDSILPKTAKVLQNKSALGTIISPIYGVNKTETTVNVVANPTKVNSIIEEPEIDMDLADLLGNKEVSEEFVSDKIVMQDDLDDLSLFQVTEEDSTPLETSESELEDEPNLFNQLF